MDVFLFILCVCVSNFSTPGDHLPALPVGGTPPGSSGGGSSVGGDWPVLLSGHGGPAVPHARAEHVWQTVLQVQVTHARTLARTLTRVTAPNL